MKLGIKYELFRNQGMVSRSTEVRYRGINLWNRAERDVALDLRRELRLELAGTTAQGVEESYNQSIKNYLRSVYGIR